MAKYLQLLKHPLSILFFFLFLFGGWVVYYIITQPSKDPVENQPNVTNETELPRKNFTESKNFLRKEVAEDNKTRYFYSSPMEYRPNEIVADEENTIYFERQVFAQNYKTPTINEYKDNLGAPDATYMGSSFYGIQPVTYIYASKGIAFIGEDTGLILEVQKFQPMTTEEYIATYGGDIEVKNDH